MSSTMSAAVVLAAVGAVPASEDPLERMINSLGDLSRVHAVLLGRDVDLLCALIRLGCAEVTEQAIDARPATRGADLAIVPRVASAAGAEYAIAHARRALSPGGRIALRAAAHPAGPLGRSINGFLRLQGFGPVTIRRGAGTTVFAAVPQPRAS